MALICLEHQLSEDSYDVEMFECPICDSTHPTLYVIRRQTSAQFGHFLAFMINGEFQVVDPTLPHMVTKIPRGARIVPMDISHYSWKNTSHYFRLIDKTGRRIRGKEILDFPKA